jgi:hypothetical protein
MSEKRDIDRATAEAMASIIASRSAFEEAVKRADAVGSKYSQTMVDDVRTSFADIAARIEAAPQAERLNLVDSAEELSRLRAYVLPKQEILIEGRLRLGDMTDWSVPGNVTDRLALETIPLLSSTDETVARAALRTLYENYDYWDWYTDVHSTSMRLAAAILLALLLLSLTSAVILLHFAHPYSGLFCAGAAGAFLSVVAKLPPVMSYGETNAYFHRILSRVGVGIAASMIGSGLLASDIISVRLPDEKFTVSQMIDGQDIVTRPGSPRDVALQAPVPESPDDRRFPPRVVLLLVALAMIFGFSERALSTFEDKILPSRVAIASPPEHPTRNGDQGEDANPKGGER